MGSIGMIELYGMTIRTFQILTIKGSNRVTSPDPCTGQIIENRPIVQDWNDVVGASTCLTRDAIERASRPLRRHHLGEKHNNL